MDAEVSGHGALVSEKVMELRRRSRQDWKVDLSTEATQAKFGASIG